MTMSMTERRVLARALSNVENGAAGSHELLKRAYEASSSANVVAIAGPPGSGKSCLVDKLALHFAGTGARVAVLACDPSSPNSHGALLGDRVRLSGTSANPNIFVRSLSQRGARGGLSSAAADCCALLRSFGFDLIILETIGAGQSDVAVAAVADCVVAISVPGLGDGLQAEKAGLLEIADLHAVNKCDLPGADACALQISAVLDAGDPGTGQDRTDASSRTERHTKRGIPQAQPHRRPPAKSSGKWRPSVHTVSSKTEHGIDALARAIEAFLDWRAAADHLQAHRGDQFANLLMERLPAALLEMLVRSNGLDLRESLDVAGKEIAAGITTPDAALDSLCQSLVPIGIHAKAKDRTEPGVRT